MVLWRALMAVLAAGLAVVLGAAVVDLRVGSAGDLPAAVARAARGTGVTNTVTAVLLDFRGYDTLLEVAVLLLAAIGVQGSRRTELAPAVPEPAAGPFLGPLVRLAVPFALVLAGYLVWVGGHAPGGAFQAGAVLAAAWLVLIIAGHRPHPALARRSWRAVLVVGFVVFLAIAAAPLIGAGALLTYPSGGAPQYLLVIEVFLTVSISAILLVLLTGRFTDHPT